MARGVVSGSSASASFADEVAIDFPSVAEVVERMQGGFLESDAAPWICAEVTLSPQQAFAGATVPIQVPVRCPCGHCGGRGEVWADVCRDCDGHGDLVHDRLVRLPLPPTMVNGARLTYRVAAPRGIPTRVDVRVFIA